MSAAFSIGRPAPAPFGQYRGRAAFTVVELLVSIAILSILVAVTLPAVLSARASSRAVSCASNLKQWALAAALHEEAFGVIAPRGFPMHSLATLFQPDLSTRASHVVRAEGDGQFSVASCPADGEARTAHGDVSYVVCRGSSDVGWSDGRPTRGVFDGAGRGEPADARMVTDGLSMTAALSERLVSGRAAESSSVYRLLDGPLRGYWYVSAGPLTEAGLLREACTGLRTTRSQTTIPGPSDRGGGYRMEYDHLLPPNRPACLRGPQEAGVFSALDSVLPATSAHDGFVNVAYLDGSVRRAADAVDERLWHALATIAGGEAVSF